MRLAILSDIHGNLPALQAVLEDMQPLAVDGILVAGDTACGPQVNECVQQLQDHHCWAILGNNEEYMLQLADGKAPPAWKTYRQFDLVRWCCQQLHPETLQYFRSLPAQEAIHLPGTHAVRLVHGSPGSSTQGIFPESDPPGLERALTQIDETVLVCGHTHLPWQRQYNGKLALNPGAVGGSLNGDTRVQYMLLIWNGDRWEAHPRAVVYDLDKIRSAFRQTGLLEASGAFGRAFLRSIESGRNYSRTLLNHAYRLAAQAGISGDQPIPDVFWEQAAQTFDFDQNLEADDYRL